MFGCFPKTLIVDSLPCESLDNPKEIIKRTYMLQTNEVPMAIEVTDEYIKWNFKVSKPKIVYFKYISDLRLVDDNSGRVEIRFKNNATNDTQIILTLDQEIAIRGYSAIKCMIESNK